MTARTKTGIVRVLTKHCFSKQQDFYIVDLYRKKQACCTPQVMLYSRVKQTYNGETVGTIHNVVEHVLQKPLERKCRHV